MVLLNSMSLYARRAYRLLVLMELDVHINVLSLESSLANYGLFQAHLRWHLTLLCLWIAQEHVHYTYIATLVWFNVNLYWEVNFLSFTLSIVSRVFTEFFEVLCTQYYERSGPRRFGWSKPAAAAEKVLTTLYSQFFHARILSCGDMTCYNTGNCMLADV